MRNNEVIEFDKKNLQEDFQYMAKSIATGKYKIGYIVIDKPWYSNKKYWTYYIVSNKYGPGGVCGGATDLGFEKVKVDPTTIEPYTQIAHIKWNQSFGIDNILVKDFLGDADDKENQVAYIGANDRIPLELWE